MVKTKTYTQNWYSLSTSEVLAELQTSSKGLSQSEVAKRLAQYGANKIAPKKQSWIKRLLEPFTSLFVGVLLIAIVISLVMHENLDAAVIGFVVTMNAMIEYFQQYSVNKVLKDLKGREDGNITVRRDGETQEIGAEQLVPGDIVYIFEGMKIPADGRLIENTSLTIDEAILTGESLPVTKTTDKISKKVEVFDQKNMVFKGTIAHSGNGMFVVCGSGNQTELGSISELASEGDIGRTPIEKKIDDITRKLIIGVASIGVLVFGLALLRGITAAEALRFSLSLVVSVVPEGLPVTLTVVLLLSAKKMARHKALVKKLSSIETMGAVTLIATDKTGTLTKNKLEIAEKYDPAKALNQTAALCINKQNGVAFDPLDELLAENFAHRQAALKRQEDFSFDQQLRLSGVLYKNASNKYVLYIKGAPEKLIAKLSSTKQASVKKLLDEYTRKGHRTIAFAHINLLKPVAALKELKLGDIILDGLVGLADPMRREVPAAIAEARAAGINVVMLTGDHKNTAEEIARQAGLIQHSNEVADSTLLESPKNAKIMQTLLERIHVFGRVLPKHKFNFLKSLHDSEVTAMTGDGVNDIPALVEADAGLAIGSGTDAAKDASDIVLLDDNFATIVETVRLGRSVIANIRKMVFYVISTGIGEASTMIGALLLALPLPVTAVQILWLNLVTDGFTLLPLGLGKPEKHQMQNPPYDPKASLLSKALASRMIISGVAMAVVALLIFNALLPKGHAYAQTAAFVSLAVAQWANALNANFETHSWVRNFTHPNYKLFIGLMFSIAFQIFALYGPLGTAFGTVELGWADLAISIIAPTIVVLSVVDLHKLILKHSGKHAATQPVQQ